MTAAQDTQTLLNRLERRGITATFEQANTLRRAELTLHRWFELECGDGNDYASWAIQRDEETDRPYMVTYPHKGDSHRSPIADRERGAEKRIARVCEELGIHSYIQTDPRGC